MDTNRSSSLMFQCLLRLHSAAVSLLIAWQHEYSKRWINRKWLIRPINQRRQRFGHFYTLFKELKRDPCLLFRYIRMDVETFNYLLKLAYPSLGKRNRSTVICAEQRLDITLRYLAAGDEISSVALDFRIGYSTALNIIKETCGIIYNVLSPIYLRPPTKQVWKNISKGFLNDWNLPNCCGAVDGKHIEIKAPPNSGSLYYNYKKSHSIVLLAACNHRYEFVLFDVGAYGGESDGGIFARSEFGKSFLRRTLNLPEEEIPLPHSSTITRLYFVGDEAFKIDTNFMRPYPGRYLDEGKRIFNYRLSRARRCIENTFGILTSRWKVFRKPIPFNPEHVDKIVLAGVCLHNFLMARTQKSTRNIYINGENNNSISDEVGRQQVSNSVLSDIQNITSHRERVTQQTHAMRDKLNKYFLTPEGEVPWQYDYLHRGKHQDL